MPKKTETPSLIDKTIDVINRFVNAAKQINRRHGMWFKLNGMLPIWNDREEDPQFVTKDSVPEGDPVEYVYRFCTIDGKREPSTRFETY